MRIAKKDLEWAASRGVINDAQVATLWQALTERTADRPKFDFIHLTYYFRCTAGYRCHGMVHGHRMGGLWGGLAFS